MGVDEKSCMRKRGTSRGKKGKKVTVKRKDEKNKDKRRRRKMRATCCEKRRIEKDLKVKK